MNRRTGPAVMIGAVLVVVFAVTAGLRMLRSPGEERSHRLDGRRVSALISLSQSVDRFVERGGTLPESLDALVPIYISQEGTRDPESDEPYGYRATGERTFELCAQFDDPDDNPPGGRFWAHGDGQQCYELSSRPGSNK